MKKNLRHILIGVVIMLLGTLSALVIADTVNQEKQLLVDGDMELATFADWLPISSATLSKETGGAEGGSRILRVAHGGQAAPEAVQVVLEVGKTYRVTGWARGDGVEASAVPRVRFGATTAWTGTNSNTWQYIDATETASSGNLRLYTNLSAAGYCEFDDILITEYTPPIVNNEDELLVDGDMDEDGTDIPFMKKFDLTQAANITADSGSITGALTYTCAGADFDGTNDYVTYTIPSTLFSTNPEISIVIEFTPDFAAADDDTRYVYDSTNGDYRVIKLNDASSNILQVYLGGTTIDNIPLGTYEASWNQNARNVLVISGTSEDTSAWLNSTQIMTNDASAWTAQTDNVNFYVGANRAGITGFDGEIHAVSIYSGLLDGTDATNLYNSVDTDDWSAGGGACLTKQSGGVEDEKQVIRVAYDGTSNPNASQNILTNGKTYRITGWTRSDGTAVPQVFNGDLSINWGGGIASTDWQYFDITGTSTNAVVFLRGGTSGVSYVEFDDVLVTEYTPPMVNDYSQGLADGDMELAGVASWAVGNSATLTKPTGERAEDGWRVLRVARNGVNDPYATQFIVSVGEEYRVTGWARSDGNATPRAFAGVDILWTGTTSTDWQYFDIKYTATGTGIRFYAITSTGTEYTEFDDIFITEL